MEDGEIEEGMVTADEYPTSEAPRREPVKSALELLRESKTSVEEIVGRMLSIKREEGNNKSEIRELLTQMFLNFVNLRQANRAILTEEDKVKAETERAKGPVDFTTLQLHNLMYEKSHYVKAIKACRDFKSKYPDIDLVSEEAFFREAPESIKDQSVAADTLMPKRLSFELHQRKELCKHRARLEQKKKSLLETIAERKKFLSSLPVHLKSLKKASIPVQNQLGIHHTKKLKQHSLAELLPPPLYVIYSQLLALKEAFQERIDLELLGSLKDAQAYARLQSKKDSGMSSNTESSRLEDDGPDDDDDGQRRRKRPKKVTSKEGSDKAGLYQVHPLKIILHVYDDETPDTKPLKLVVLKFEYFLKLNVVCVGAEGSPDAPEKNIFCNLFPDDAGLEPPHQSTKLILGDGQVFDENRTSRPYKWVQHLAGIDILPEVSPILFGQDTPDNIDTAKSDASVPDLSLYRQQHRVETVLQRIRSRKKAHLALAEQLDMLMKHELPAVNCEDAPWALHKVLCASDSWLQIRSSARKLCSLTLSSVEQVPEPMEIDGDRRSLSGKEDVESIREDGELPSLVTAAALITTSSDQTPSKVSSLARSRQLALMTKNLDSPISSKGKSPSFKKYEDDLDLVLDDDSEVDEPAGNNEAHVEAFGPVKADNSWVDYGAREFALVFSRKTDDGKLWKLEAMVQISMEYPLRPPFFSLSLHTSSGNDNGTSESDHYNELRAMEAEVNLHMLKIVPSDQENYLISHQIRCLAMLFDYYMDDPSKRGTATSVVDVGLCKPVDGKLLVRSFRGRDHRKMISWKDRGCASGYPC